MPTSGFKRLRVSDFSLAGQTEEITSDVKLPNSRIQSKGDAGAESSSGNLETEFFIDEVDMFLKAMMLDGTSDAKSFKLGSTQQTFTFIEVGYQGDEPTYEVFTGVQVGSATLTFELDSKVKVSLSLVGQNNPTIIKEGDDEDVDAVIASATDFVDASAKPTKSFNTRNGAISIVAGNGEFSDTKNYSDLVRSVSITINQNPDSTGALFQTKSIDNSLGDEAIDGTIEVWNPQDNRTVGLYNSAKSWADDVVVTIKLGEEVYTVSLKVSLKTPTKSKDGNKRAFSIPFQAYDAKDGFAIVKA